MNETLLSRLQSATGPSRELDAEIALANGWKFGLDGHSDISGLTYWRSLNGDIHPGPPRYTESIDAALTLVPKGWAIHTIHGGKIKDDGKQSWTVGLCVNGNWQRESEGFHESSLAIALLITIERAKEDIKP